MYTPRDIDASGLPTEKILTNEPLDNRNDGNVCIPLRMNNVLDKG